MPVLIIIVCGVCGALGALFYDVRKGGNDQREDDKLHGRSAKARVGHVPGGGQTIWEID